MKRILVALALIGTLLVGSVVSAQEVTPAHSGDRCVTSEQQLSNHLHFSYEEGTLYVTLADEPQTSSSLTTEALGVVSATQGEAVLQAVYTYANFSEVIDDYWKTLTSLGFTATMSSVGQEVVVSSFENGDGRLEATFTLQGNDVAVTLAWV